MTPADGWGFDGSVYVKDFPYGTSYSDIAADFGTPTKEGYAFTGFDPGTGIAGPGGDTLTAQWAE